MHLQIRYSVSFPERDLENVQVADKRSQAWQALLARTADTDQQSITAWTFKYTVDATSARQQQDFETATSRGK